MQKYTDRLTTLLSRYSGYIFAGGAVAILVMVYQAWDSIQNYMLLWMLSPKAPMLAAVQRDAADLTTMMLGIFVEALPFVILGVLLSSIIQVWLPRDFVVRHLPQQPLLRRLSLSFMGTLMPVCECGNVPVARSLIVQGVTPGEAIVFLLSAPSVNIVTFVATWEAFNTNHGVAWVRLIGTVIIANITAYVLVRVQKTDLLTSAFAKTCKQYHGPKRSLSNFSRTFYNDFWMISRLLAVGALIAAATQILIPRDVITSIASNPVLAVVAMLALAFVISICSSVDAFFALAFVSSFPLGAIAAFLLSGPMVDLKMIALLRSTFTTRTIALLCLLVLGLSFITGVGLVYFWE